jgi:hypothetical protein
MKKTNIHKMEQIGFFITMLTVSIVIASGIIGGLIKLVEIINR